METHLKHAVIDIPSGQAEMHSPMDDAFEKLKQQGPPQWFVEAMTLDWHVLTIWGERSMINQSNLGRETTSHS